MRPTTDLFELDFVFSQQRPLTREEFIDQCKRRGLHLRSWDQLEALHRARLLVPMYRFVKNVRPIIAEGRRRKMPLSTILVNNIWDGAILRNYLHGYKNVGHPQDPRAEPFQAWNKYARKLDGQTIWRSSFLYSPYQLLLIPYLQEYISKMRWRKTPRPFSNFDYSYNIKLSDSEQTEAAEHVIENDELVLLLSALEIKYRPHIVGTITNKRGRSLDQWSEYNKKFKPGEMLRWLSLEPEVIRNTAQWLLNTAYSIDPLRDWIELIRLCNPKKWEKLHGDALIAMDHRIAAEMLLRFYEDLVQEGIAAPLEESPKDFTGPYDGRLGTNRYELDETLMDFGVSPQPSLLLVLEGETEMLLVPRVMKILGIPVRNDLIKLFNSKGIDRKLGLLAEYVITPELGDSIDEGYILTRPPTHFLRIVDPESGFVDRRLREKHRKILVDSIWQGLPDDYREQIPKSEINHLVEIRTWDRKRQAFEFAHFTDRQIAWAILDTYHGSSAPSLAEVSRLVGIKRKHAQNIKDIWKRWKGRKPTKGRIAEALWPILERRIETALSRKTQRKIPVVRIVLHAIECAQSLRRDSVMIMKK